MKKIILLFALFPTTLGIYAQEFSKFTNKDLRKDENYGWFDYIQVTTYYGKHTVEGDKKYLLPDHFWGTGIRFGTQSTGRKDWQRLHKYPQYGFGISIFDLGGPEVEEMLGVPMSFYFFYGAPIVRIADYRLNVDIELGISTDFKKYDPDNNSEQIFIGAKTNLHSNFSLQLYHKLSERMDIAMGLSFMHFSNGKMFSPNKGINLLGLNLSAAYHYNPVKRFTKNVDPDYQPAIRPTFVEKKMPKSKHEHELSFMGSLGTVQPGPKKWRHRNGDMDTTTAIGPRYLTSSISADYAYRISHCVKLAAGIDAFHDGSAENLYEDILPQNTQLGDKTYCGVHIGMHYLIERITFVFNYGRYFYKKFEPRGPWYMRVGGRINLNDKWAAQITLKTRNGGIADFIEWGVVYKIKWDNQP